jgi:primosomal replication protein N
MNKIEENNQVTIRGEIVSDFFYSHELYGERFFGVNVEVQRLSGCNDIIPVMVSERLVDVNNDRTGLMVEINGQFRSYNRHEGERSRLVLSVFAREMEFVEEIEESSKTNQIYLEGYICKTPIYRETPLGREIADLLLAVNRPYGKSDYIPCICWGRNARYASSLEVGSRLAVTGRIQSRQYLKKLPDGQTEERTAYEVSISKMEVPVDEE